MERFLYGLSDFGKLLIIVIVTILIIKIIYWISLSSCIGNIEDKTIHIDKTFTNTKNAIIEQNKIIISNQEKIIELLQKNQKEE